MRFTLGGFLLDTWHGLFNAHRLASSPVTSSLLVGDDRPPDFRTPMQYTLATKRTVINFARSRVCFSFAIIESRKCCGRASGGACEG